MRVSKETAAVLATAAVLGAARFGARYNPGPAQPRTAAWYARLDKPSWTPPGAVIGAAWTALDLLLCVAGYRLLAAPPSDERRTALGLWGVTVAGLAFWPYLFFGRKRLGESLGALGGMLGAAAGAVAAASRVDRVAAAAVAPLIGWLSFAGLLNEEIWRRN